MNKRVVLILVAMISIGLLLFFLLFEKKEIVDTNWNEDMVLDSKKPFGLYVFHHLLEDYYGDQKVKRINNLKALSEEDAKKTRLILVNEYFRFEDEENDLLETFIQGGGDLVIVCSNFAVGFNGEIFEAYRCRDSVTGTDLNQFYYGQDTLNAFNYIHHNTSFDDTSKYAINAVYLDISVEDDSLISEPSAGDTFSTKAEPYKTLPENDLELNDSTVVDSSALLNADHEFTKESYLSNQDCPIFVKYNWGTGKIWIHSMPLLFSNQASLQPFYLEHFNQFVQQIGTGKKVLISTSNSPGEYQDESPLQILLANKNLAAAYYSLFFGIFVYLLFGTKRKQRAIPVYQSKENTSLEYVDTLSRLYEMQNQPDKLVGKMEENFYHDIQNRFFIHKNETDFADLVSRKTKIDIRLITAILNDFQKIRSVGRCDEDQLINLYSKIEKFKTLSHDGGRK